MSIKNPPANMLGVRKIVLKLNELKEKNNDVDPIAAHIYVQSTIFLIIKTFTGNIKIKSKHLN